MNQNGYDFFLRMDGNIYNLEKDLNNEHSNSNSAKFTVKYNEVFYSN